MKKRDILLLLTSAFILVIAWVGFSIYHNLATSTVSDPVGQQIRPIPASFDTESISQLKRRKKVLLDFKELETTATNSSQASPTPTLIATPSPTLIPLLTATPSGSVATEGGTLLP